MTWDVALPKDEPEVNYLVVGTKYRVYVYTDRHGDTYYQGQFKSSCMGGGRWDDSDCDTTNEDMALAWFYDNEYPLDENE